MQNFVYCNPVKIVFGKGTIAKLSELIGPKEKILLTYGGGSVLDGSKFIAAAIDRTVKFFHSINMPTSLKDYGITQKDTRKVVDRFAQRGDILGEHGDIDAKAVRKILKLCL
jgi:alcohol dehydrogenase YqhD (iron-dependent ADH family)